MSMRMVTLACAGLALVGAAASGADSACAADTRRFCEGKPPIELLSCLQAHQPDLSDACRQRIETALVNVSNAKLDCEQDAFAFCRDEAPGQAMVSCLSKHQGELTRRCQSVFDDYARREAANSRVCGNDGKRLCANARPGKGEIHLCLLFRGKDILSGECREAMAH